MSGVTNHGGMKMGALIQKDDLGNWGVKGLPWSNLYVGQVITREINEKLYGCLCKLKDYENLGTVDEFEQAKEKTIAKKPLPNGTHKGFANQCCPDCRRPLTNRCEEYELPYCEQCGQKLDWNKEAVKVQL